MKIPLFRNLPCINSYRKMQTGFVRLILAAALCLWSCCLAGCNKKSAPEAAVTSRPAEEVQAVSSKTDTAAEASLQEEISTSVLETSVSATSVPETSAPETFTKETSSQETEPLPIPEKDELVCVRDYIPDILVDLKYATTDNFTGQKIYDFTEAYLRYGTIEKLKQAQDMLRNQGMSLKIWDAYRPVSAQFRLWEVCPNSTYVANPNKGYSSHSRGNTVDITLVYADGTEVKMPTGFDDFSSLADRNYSDCDTIAAQNATLLENTMKQCGFKPYSGEWWHFSDEVSYPVDEHSLDGSESQ